MSDVISELQRAREAYEVARARDAAGSTWRTRTAVRRWAREVHSLSEYRRRQMERRADNAWRNR